MTDETWSACKLLSLLSLINNNYSNGSVYGPDVNSGTGTARKYSIFYDWRWSPIIIGTFRPIFEEMLGKKMEQTALVQW